MQQKSTAVTLKACVIGHPVAHSLSPLIHNHWIARHGLRGRYEKHDLSPEALQTGLKALIADGYNGFNVTLPHKQAVMNLCDEIDMTATAIGAVNTLYFQDGKLRGLNTDWYGFVQGVLDAVPSFDFAAAPVLVLGAGGAARAVLYGLKSQGAQDIRIANRTTETAEIAAQQFGARAVPWEKREEAAAGAGLVVNTTSLGMRGKEPLDFALDALSEAAAVCDIVYAPLQTELLRAAKARGNLVIDGLGMLMNQARPAFEAWTGLLPEADAELRHLLEKELGERAP